MLRIRHDGILFLSFALLDCYFRLDTLCKWNRLSNNILRHLSIRKTVLQANIWSKNRNSTSSRILRDLSLSSDKLSRRD